MLKDIKKIVGFFTALFIALILIINTGCKAKEEPTKPAAEKPTSGGTLVFGYEQEPETLNPFILGGDLSATGDVANLILPKFFIVTPDFKYQPSLLAEIPDEKNGGVKKSPFTITYKLKKEAKWSDGKPITSEDVKFTWETIMNKKWEIVDRSGYELIKKIDTPDAQTVVVTFDSDYASWRDLWSGAYYVLPKHALEKADLNKIWNSQITISGGPFSFKSWKAGDSITLVRNKNYWGKKAYLDSIVFKYIPDTNTALAQFKAGEVDMIYPTPDIDLLNQLESIEGAQVLSGAGTQFEQLGFNMKNPILKNKKVREAIAYAIDRKAISEQVMKGSVKPLQSIIVPEQSNYYVPTWEKYTKDIDKAKKLLKESGEKDISLSISTTSGNAARERLEQIIQANLKEIGIELKIKNTDEGTFFDSWLTDGTFDIGDWGFMATPDPSGQVITFSGEQMPPDGLNNFFYTNERVTKLADEQDTELDDNKRAGKIKEIQEILAEDLPTIPLFQRVTFIAFGSKVKGPKLNPTIEGSTWNASEWWIKQ